MLVRTTEVALPHSLSAQFIQLSATSAVTSLIL